LIAEHGEYIKLMLTGGRIADEFQRSSDASSEDISSERRELAMLSINKK